MKVKRAEKIIREMQKWRRGEKPYDAIPSKRMPYSPEEFGEALDSMLLLAEVLKTYEPTLYHLVL